MLGNPQIPPEARGPRLLNMMCEGTMAAKATKHLSPDGLAVPGGDRALIEVLDARFPDIPENTKLEELLADLNGFDAEDQEETETMISRCRDAILVAEGADIS